MRSLCIVKWLLSMSLRSATHCVEAPIVRVVVVVIFRTQNIARRYVLCDATVCAVGCRSSLCLKSFVLQAEQLFSASGSLSSFTSKLSLH